MFHHREPALKNRFPIFVTDNDVKSLARHSTKALQDSAKFPKRVFVQLKEKGI